MFDPCDTTQDTASLPSASTNGSRLFVAFLALALVGVGLAVAASPASAASDGETLLVGEGAEFSSIQNAIDQASSGDTVAVRPGGYAENLTVDVDGLTLCSTTADGTDCDPIPSSTVISSFARDPIAIRIQATDVTVEGFSIRSPFEGGTGIDASGADGVRLVNNDVEVGLDSDEPFAVQSASAAASGDLEAAAYWQDPYVVDTLQSGVLEDIAAKRAGDEGLLAIAPVTDPSDHVGLYYEGQAPAEAEEMAEGSTDPAIELYEDQGPPEKIPTLGDEGLDDDRIVYTAEEASHLEAPAPPEGVRPGTRITGNGCSANWIWETTDTDGNTQYWLGTAGHCVPGGIAGDGSWQESTATIEACFQNCDRFNTVGPQKFVELGVSYGVDNGVGEDFAITKIPQDVFHLVNTSLPTWGGPVGAEDGQPAAATPSVQYGHGQGTGDTFLTQARAGVFMPSPLINDDNDVHWMGTTSTGDSGSAVGSGTTNTTHGLVGDKAAGIVTHLCGAHLPSYNCGTSIPRAKQLVQDNMGLDLRVVTQDESLISEDAPIEAPINVEVTDVSSTTTAKLEVTWEQPVTSAPADAYRVYRDGVEVANVTDTRYLDDSGLTEGVQYCYQVDAWSQEKGASSLSSEVCQTPQLSDLPPPDYARARDQGTGDTVAVHWGQPGSHEADAYRVERILDGQVETVFELSADQRSIEDADLEEGSTYTYNVTAEIDGELSEAASATITVTEDDPVWRQAHGSADAQAYTGAAGDITLPTMLDTADVGGPVSASPIVAEIDGDRGKEVVAVNDPGADNGSAWIEIAAFSVSTDGLSEDWRHVVTMPLHDASGFGHVVAADLNGDGLDEVVALSDYHSDGTFLTNLTVLDGRTGTVISEFGDLNPGHDVPMSVVQLEDGKDHVLVFDDNRFINTHDTRMTALTLENGTLVNDLRVVVGPDSAQAGPAVIENPGGDGPSVLVTTGTRPAGDSLTQGDDVLFRCDLSTTGNLSADCGQVAGIDSFTYGLSTGYVDETPTPSAIVTGLDSVFVVDPFTGDTATLTTPDPTRNHVALGDVTANGTLDLVPAAKNQFINDLVKLGDVYAYETDDASFRQLGVAERDSAPPNSDEVPSGTTVADITGDGSLDALVADESGEIAAVSLSALASNASSPILWETSLESGITAPLALGDVTGDGRLEVVAATEEGQLGVVDDLLETPDELVGIEISDAENATVQQTGVTVHEGATAGVLARAGAPNADIASSTIDVDSPSADAARVAGVQLSAGSTGASVTNTELSLPAAWCDVETAGCQAPLAVGVQTRASATVEQNTITADLADVGEERLAGTIGVHHLAPEPVTVADNTISQFGVGIFARGEGLLATGNTIDTAATGIQIAADDLELTGNDVSLADQGVFVAGATAFSPQNVTLRGNDLAATNVSLKFEPGKAGSSVDARLNVWGTVGEDAIRLTRIDDPSGENGVLVTPYRDSSGETHPPLPEVYCFTSDGREKVTETLTLQAAIDVALPETCADQDGDGGIDRQILLRRDQLETYDAAVIDADVSLFSMTASEDVARALQGERGDVPGGAVIEAAAGEAALSITAGAHDTLVDGVTLDARDGAAGLNVSGLAADEDVVVQDSLVVGNAAEPVPGVIAEEGRAPELANLLVTDADPAVTFRGTEDGALLDSRIRQRIDGLQATMGVHLDEATDATVRRTSIHGNTYDGSAGIRADGAAGLEAIDNVVRGSGMGIYVVQTDAPVLRDNVVVATPTDQLAQKTEGISLFASPDAVTENNLLKGVHTGLSVTETPGLDSNLDAFRAVTTGVEVTALDGGADGASDAHLHNASLNATVTPLKLTDTTSGLAVNATCNDWGVYQRDLIEARVDDGGQDNAIAIDPWTSLNQDDGQLSCLLPPQASFQIETAEPITRLDEVSFNDTSEAGSRPIAEWRYDFGDGSTHTATAADGEAARNPEHSYDQVGTFDTVLEVEDSDGQRSQAVRHVVVENIEPEFDSAISDQAVVHTHNVSFTARALDAEGDPLTFDAHLVGTEGQLPAGFTVTNEDNAADFHWDPAPDQYGTYDLNVTVTDGYDTIYQHVRVTVINNEPAFDPVLPGVLGGAVNRTMMLEVDPFDPDDLDEIQSFSANLSELPAAKEDIWTQDADTTSGILSWTPETGDNGTYEISFTASSPARTVTKLVTVDVRADNAAPTVVVTANDPFVDGGTAQVYLEADDAENDSIEWTAEIPDGIDAEDTSLVPQTDVGDEASWSWDIPLNTSGTFDVTFVADDGFGEVETTETLAIESKPWVDDRLPMETETGLFTIEPLVGSDVLLSFRAIDVDGDLSPTNMAVNVDGQTLAVDRLSETSYVDVEDPTLYGAVYAFSEPGTQTVTFDVTDADGNTESETLDFIDVQPNAPPDVTVEDEVLWTNATSPNGASVELVGDAQDPEGRSLDEDSFVWDVPGQTNLAGREVTATLGVGTHNVGLTVTDPFGVASTQTVVVHVDDTVSADGELDAEKTEEGHYHVDPVATSFEKLSGTATVLDDIEDGVEDAHVQGTVEYYGAEMNDVGMTVATFATSTDADGEARFSYEQDLLGVQPTSLEASWLSAPGWHEITLEVTATSRPAAPLDGFEHATETIRYFVGPSTTGEAGAHASAACYDGPASDDDRNGSADGARATVSSSGDATTATPGPENVTEGAATFAGQGGDCARGFGQASLILFDTVLQACYDGEVSVHVSEAPCPQNGDGVPLQEILAGDDDDGDDGGAEGASLLSAGAEGACFVRGDGGHDEAHIDVASEGMATATPELAEVASALADCGVTGAKHCRPHHRCPTAGSFLAVTGSAAGDALVLQVDTVPATDLATGQTEEPGKTGVEGQGACYYGDEGAQDSGSVFLGPPPEVGAPNMEAVAAGLTACGDAVANGETPDGGSHARFTATVAGSTVVVSADTVPVSDAIT